METFACMKRRLPSKKKWYSTSFALLLGLHITCVGSIDVRKQRHNLHGKPGQGYYIQVDIGTPSQRVCISHVYFIISRA